MSNMISIFHRFAQDNKVLPSAASFGLDGFDFNYLKLSDEDTLKVSWKVKFSQGH